MTKKKLLLLALFLVLIILASVFIVKKVLGADIAANTVDTSTNNSATQSTEQRKTFYDSTNSLYWVFYYNGSAIKYSYSSNGSSWASGGTTGVGTSDFSVWYVSGTATIYLVYTTGTSVSVEKGTLGATSITWSGLTSNPCSSGTADQNVNISRDINGRLWVIFSRLSGANRNITACKSVNPDDTTSWNVATTVDSYAYPGTLYYPIILPMTNSANMYAIYSYTDSANTKKILGKLWTDGSSSWASSPDTIASATATALANIKSAVSVSSDTVHLIYQAPSDSKLYYAQYSGGAWGAPVNIDSNTTDTYPTLSVNTANGNLYAFYIRSNIIYYRQGTSPYASINWSGENTLVSSGTNVGTNSSYNVGNNYAIMTWTDGTGSPYNVRFYGLSLGGATPPTKIVFTNAARTLTAGSCNGAASVFTMQLQDNGGTPQNPTQTTVVQVTSNSPSYTIYSDSGCGIPVSGGNFTFTTSDNTKSVYIIDNRKSVSNFTLTGTRTSGDTLTTGTQNYTVNAGAVSQLVITLPGQTFTDGSGNSGTVSNQAAHIEFILASITATDSNFNINTGYSGSKTLVYSGPNGSPAYTTAVSFTSGQSTTTLFTTLSNAETITITATDGGQYGYASSSLTVDPPPVINRNIRGGLQLRSGIRL